MPAISYTDLMPSSAPRYFLDTEGKMHLTEVAVVDEHGKCVYEAFAKDSSKHQYKPLRTICCELAERLNGSTVVCHYAEHDREILRRSFRRAGVSFPDVRFVCTMQLAKRLFPAGVGSTSKWQHSSSAQFSYSLQHLSHAFKLQVDGKRFNDAYAHSARYDAMFTRVLHNHLIHHEGEQRFMDNLKTIPNPFSSSRVDDPFQQHPDLREIYGEQFQGLLSALDELAHDPNQQSRGAVVIGEPGSGKTHLMMRLASAKLQSNPLFYVRQPNNPENVLYHTYARVIESLFEPIPNTPYTQLQRFFGNCFLQILRNRPEAADTERGSKIISTLEQNSLSLFQRQAGKDSKQYYDEWKFILNHVSRYWGERYSSAGHAVNVLKAFVRYCGYLDNERRGLTRRYFTAHQLDKDELAKVGLEDWSEDIDREGFALEAMTVLGRLSILDEPLILVFDQLEGLSNKPAILERFADAVKDILSYVPNSLVIFNLFPDRWQQFQSLFDESVLGRIAQVHVQLHHPDREHLAAILDYKAQQADLSFAEIFNRSEQNDILQQTSIRAALNRAAAYYRHKTQGAPLTFADTPKTTAVTPAVNQQTGNQETGNLEQRVARLEHTLAALAQALTGNITTFTNAASAQTPTNDTDAELEIDLTDFDPVMQMLEDEIHTRRKHWEKRYDQAQIIDDEDDLGKLMTLADAYAQYRPIIIDNVRLGKSKVPANLSIQVNDAPARVIGFLYADSGAFTARMKNFNKLVIHHPDMHFTLLRDQREKAITGKVGVQEIDKLNNADNGSFRVFDKTDRVNFELAYGLLVDVQNRDLDASSEDVLKALEQHMGDWWLLECFR
jgi:DNA polymerase III epsilon subunit-like protein